LFEEIGGDPVDSVYLNCQSCHCGPLSKVL